MIGGCFSFLLAIILPFSSVYAQSLKEDGQRLNTGFSKSGKLSIHALRAIDLSDEQRDDIRAITESATSNLRQTTEELNEVRKSLQESVHTSNPARGCSSSTISIISIFAVNHLLEL